MPPFQPQPRFPSFTSLFTQSLLEAACPAHHRPRAVPLQTCWPPAGWAPCMPPPCRLQIPGEQLQTGGCTSRDSVSLVLCIPSMSNVRWDTQQLVNNNSPLPHSYCATIPKSGPYGQLCLSAWNFAQPCSGMTGNYTKAHGFEDN